MYIKYTKAEHLTEAVDQGRVHIGTFHYYQKAYRETWGDSDEGPVGFILRNDTEELWRLSWEGYVIATQDFNVARNGS